MWTSLAQFLYGSCLPYSIKEATWRQIPQSWFLLSCPSGFSALSLVPGRHPAKRTSLLDLIVNDSSGKSLSAYLLPLQCQRWLPSNQSHGLIAILQVLHVYIHIYIYALKKCPMLVSWRFRLLCHMKPVMRLVTQREKLVHQWVRGLVFASITSLCSCSLWKQTSPGNKAGKSWQRWAVRLHYYYYR